MSPEPESTESSPAPGQPHNAPSRGAPRRRSRSTQRRRRGKPKAQLHGSQASEFVPPPAPVTNLNMPSQGSSAVPEEAQASTDSRTGIAKAIEELKEAIDTLKEVVEDLDLVMEYLELAEVQKQVDEKDIESLRKLVQHLQRSRPGRREPHASQQSVPPEPPAQPAASEPSESQGEHAQRSHG